MTKNEIISELESKDIEFNPRNTKAELEEILSQANLVPVKPITTGKVFSGIRLRDGKWVCTDGSKHSSVQIAATAQALIVGA